MLVENFLLYHGVTKTHPTDGVKTKLVHFRQRTNHMLSCFDQLVEGEKNFTFVYFGTNIWENKHVRKNKK